MKTFLLICLLSFQANQDSLQLSTVKPDSAEPASTADTSLSVPAQTPEGKSVVSTPPPGMEWLPMNKKKTKFAYFDTTQSYLRTIANGAFDAGEKLIFIVRYGPVIAGSASLSIPQITTIKGHECYQIVSEARSSKFFSSVFEVRDRVESYMDKDGLFSWRFEKHLKEGKYRADQYVEFDHIKRIAVTDKNDTLRIPPCIQDILTSFYYIRTMPIVVGKSIFIDNHADRKLYPMEVKVLRKERIQIRAGSFNCLVVEPMLRSDAIFKQRGRLLIWLTDDHRKIPVQMQSKVIIGSITAELKSMEGTR